MEKIASFTADHTKITPGIYVSRIDGDITTYDLRMKKPNGGDYLSDLEMHTFEHMLATFMRNGKIKDSVIYVGPMGCRTGFYLLIRNADNEKTLDALTDALEGILAYEGKVPGADIRECGNYRQLDLSAAKKVTAEYLDALKSKKHTFKYEGDPV